MPRDQVKEILERVLTWPGDDLEKLAWFVHEIEQWRAGDQVTDGEVAGKRH